MTNYQLRRIFRARAHGARYAWSIVNEAKRAGIPYYVAFAVVEQESNFQNVFGHDPGGLFPGEKVTQKRVDALIDHVVNKKGVSNGVGFTQLTFIGFILQANKLNGGASKVRNQLRIGFRLMAELRRVHGSWHEAFRAYNGVGPAAERYADLMDVRAAKWRHWLRDQ